MYLFVFNSDRGSIDAIGTHGETAILALKAQFEAGLPESTSSPFLVDGPASWEFLVSKLEDGEWCEHTNVPEWIDEVADQIEWCTPDKLYQRIVERTIAAEKYQRDDEAVDALLDYIENIPITMTDDRERRQHVIDRAINGLTPLQVRI